MARWILGSVSRRVAQIAQMPAADSPGRLGLSRPLARSMEQFIFLRAMEGSDGIEPIQQML
jgi:hypothetical protein